MFSRARKGFGVNGSSPGTYSPVGGSRPRGLPVFRVLRWSAFIAALASVLVVVLIPGITELDGWGYLSALAFYDQNLVFQAPSMEPIPERTTEAVSAHMNLSDVNSRRIRLVGPLQDLLVEKPFTPSVSLSRLFGMPSRQKWKRALRARDMATGNVIPEWWWAQKKVHWVSTKGFHYKSKRLGTKGGYISINKLIKDRKGAYRAQDLASFPNSCTDPQTTLHLRNISCPPASNSPFLAQFSNVFVDEAGRIFVPRVAWWHRLTYHVERWGGSRRKPTFAMHLYEITGGCCDKNREIYAKPGQNRVLSDVNLGTVPRHDHGFYVGQFHGSTFYHVMHEVLPRIFSFWKTLLLLPPSTSLVVSGTGTTKEVLRVIGFPQSRILPMGTAAKYRYFKKLWVAAPFIQDSGYSKAHFEMTVPRILRDAVEYESMNSTVDSAQEALLTEHDESSDTDQTLPVLVLIARAQSRSVSKRTHRPTCTGRRCIANFESLKKALVEEFRGLLQVKVFSGGPDVFERGLLLFSNATIVVGAHGAGFQNLVFMKPNQSYCIHFGGSGMWRLYAQLATKFQVDFRNIWTEGLLYDTVNVHVNEKAALIEVWRIVERLPEVSERAPRMRAERDRDRGYVLNSSETDRLVMKMDPVNGSTVHIYN